MYLLENSKLLRVLTNSSQGDFSSGYSVLKPPGDIITDYCEISKAQFGVLSKNGHLSIFNSSNGVMTDSVKLKGTKFEKETIDFVSVSVCPKSKYLAVSSCLGFPEGSLKKYSITFLKLSNRNVKIVDTLSVFDGTQFTNLYSIQFYPSNIDNLPVLYCAESGGEFSLSSYTLEEIDDGTSKLKS